MAIPGYRVVRVRGQTRLIKTRKPGRHEGVSVGRNVVKRKASMTKESRDPDYVPADAWWKGEFSSNPLHDNWPSARTQGTRRRR